MNKHTMLEQAQSDGLRLVGYLGLASIPLPVLAAWAVGNSFVVPLVASLVLGGLGVMVRRGGGPMARAGAAVALVGQVMLLTAALAGHPWQVDSHMVYFAALATLVLLLDPAAILAAAGAVVAHHLLLTFLVPALVYPSVDLWPNVARTLLHGAVVAVETVALFHLARSQVSQSRRIEAEAADLARALDRSRTAQERLSLAEAEQAGVMDRLSLALARLATGDLSATLPEAFPQRFERLRTDYNDALAALSAALQEVSDNADSIRSDTGNIASAAQMLSQRTEEQSHALNQVARQIDEIGTFMADSASEAKEAMARTDTSRAEAEAGTRVVNDAVQAMTRIEESSNRIRTITDVIDDLAVQTNLLALNAGVEAARAGSAGQGFAVVASEVRALAQRSSNAAREITALISESTTHVQTGVKLVGETGEVLNGVLSSVQHVSASMGRIAASVGTHSDGINDLRRTMSDLDTLTQQNAAMFEETSAATTALTAATNQLNDVIRQFVERPESMQVRAA